MTDSEDDFDDDDDVGEFGDVERELYTSLIPQPKSFGRSGGPHWPG